MWETLTHPLNPDATLFKDVYSSKIRYYLSIQKNVKQDERTPTFSAPYDWDWIEREIQYLTNENMTPMTYTNWYPMHPNYSVEDTPDGRLTRLQHIAYGIKHMTADAVYKHQPTPTSFTLKPESHTYRMPWIIFIVDLLLLLIIAYALWYQKYTTPSIVLVPFFLLVCTLLVNRL